MDLEYPVELHKAQNGHPLAPEKRNRERIDVGLSKMLAEELGLRPNETKLVLMLQDKKNYVVVYRNL